MLPSPSRSIGCSSLASHFSMNLFSLISVVRLRLPIPDPAFVYFGNVNPWVCIGGVGFFELLRILVVFVIGRNVVGAVCSVVIGIHLFSRFRNQRGQIQASPLPLSKQKFSSLTFLSPFGVCDSYYTTCSYGGLRYCTANYRSKNFKGEHRHRRVYVPLCRLIFSLSASCRHIRPARFLAALRLLMCKPTRRVYAVLVRRRI